MHCRRRCRAAEDRRIRPAHRPTFQWPGGPGQLGQSQRAVAGVEDQVRGPAADERVGVGHAHVVVNVSAGHQVRDVGDSVHVAEEFVSSGVRAFAHDDGRRRDAAKIDGAPARPL